MGKYYAGYQLHQVIGKGVGPSKVIWMGDFSRRVFWLDYGSEALRGDPYINSGPSLAGAIRYVPKAPIEPEDHIPEILAIFAPQLFITKAKYDKISTELIKSKKGKIPNNMLDLDTSGTPKALNDLIFAVEDIISIKLISSTLSQANFNSTDGKKWVFYCFRLDQKV